MPHDPTTRLRLTLPSGGDAPPDVAGDYHAAFTDLDGKVALDDQGVFSARPAASPAARGTYYYATDRKLLYRCTGVEWRQVSTWTRRIESASSGQGFSALGWHAPWNVRPTVTAPFTGRFDVRASATAFIFGGGPAVIGIRLAVFNGAWSPVQTSIRGGVGLPEQGGYADLDFGSASTDERLLLDAGSQVSLEVHSLMRIGSVIVLLGPSYVEIQPVQEF